jgi:sugar phosphate isomerase/epimerase
MARYRIAVNMEFCRSADKSFEAGVRIAAELGYRWVEPMVHTGFPVNWDTGSSYLAGLEDPYEGLTAVRDHVRHIHAKDISMNQSSAERGKVTGTPVGCACGEGVVDWDKVFRILDPLDREIFLSVECGRIDEAERSLSFLTKALGSRLIAD